MPDISLPHAELIYSLQRLCLGHACKRQVFRPIARRRLAGLASWAFVLWAGSWVLHLPPGPCYYSSWQEASFFLMAWAWRKKTTESKYLAAGLWPLVAWPSTLSSCRPYTLEAWKPATSSKPPAMPHIWLSNFWDSNTSLAEDAAEPSLQPCRSARQKGRAIELQDTTNCLNKQYSWGNNFGDKACRKLSYL